MESTHDAPPAGPTGALVLASHGARASLRLDGGEQVLARARGRRLQFVCGDRVLAAHDARHGEWQVESVLPRASRIRRTNLRGEAELVAANLTGLWVVVAPRPAPDWFLVDRYAAAAASAGLACVLVSGKLDLDRDPAHEAALAAYAAIGIGAVACSAHTGAGLDGLREALRGQRVMLVGQSGVGKSSLVRELVPGADAEVGELMRDDQGRHTTSVARWHDLPGGGALVDSPGVRDFAPAPEDLDPRTLGFPELAARAGGCRFADCRHFDEPACAVRAAVAGGTMDPRRYESYRRLRRLQEQLQARAGPRRR